MTEWTASHGARLQQLQQGLAASAAATAGAARLFRAPGRVNLIGEHTDYNEGWVMPLAIGRDTWVLAQPRTDDRLVVHALDAGETLTHTLGGPLSHAVGSGHWMTYVAGVAECLRATGVPVRGAHLVIQGTVPLGAGLSSSASLEVAVASALSALAGAPVGGIRLAQVCQRAEHDYVGTRCGIMDQYVSVHGKAGHAVQLDCRTLQHVLVPLGVLATDVRIVVCNSMVRHALAGGEYNQRRAQCEAAVAHLQPFHPAIRALRDVSLADLQSHEATLDPLVYRRARHVITENDRVERLATALAAADLTAVAALLYASHASLRDDYEVSCRELDTLVEIASGLAGVHGSRMTGGGFGGCTVTLVEADHVDAFRDAVQREYVARVGHVPDVEVFAAADGAGELLVQ